SRTIQLLDESVQRRFAAPLPDSLGMSRILLPSSFGRHFQPDPISERDFRPAGGIEENIVRELEREGLHVGLYLFGTAIAQAEPEIMNFRALKGPGIITRGTP